MELSIYIKCSISESIENIQTNFIRELQNVFEFLDYWMKSSTNTILVIPSVILSGIRLA